MLLVRASARSGTPGVWSLPGGAVDHGEDPYHTVVRETAAETGLSVAVAGPGDVLADMRALPDRGVTIHTDRLIYEVAVRGGTLHRPGRPADRPGPLAHPGRGRGAAAAPVHRRCAGPAGRLGRPAPRRGRPSSRRSTPCPARTGCTGRSASPRTRSPPTRRGRLLLTRIADGYPGAGCWHLPGGGTDYGEQPGAALIRELVEETGQAGGSSSCSAWPATGTRPRSARRATRSTGTVCGPSTGWWSTGRPRRDRHATSAAPPSEARWFAREELSAARTDRLTEVTAEALRAARLTA